MAFIATADESEMAALNARPESGKLFVEFFMDAVENEAKSLKAGRPIFEDKEFVKIMVPGDNSFSVVHEVHEVHKRRFARAYEAFKAGREQAVEGTPLITIPFLKKGECMELAKLGIKTAEQLVNMSDANGQHVMGFQGLRKRVSVFLEDAAKAAPAQKMAVELGKRDQEIETLKKMLEEQRKRLEEVSGRK